MKTNNWNRMPFAAVFALLIAPMACSSQSEPADGGDQEAETATQSETASEEPTGEQVAEQAVEQAAEGSGWDRERYRALMKESLGVEVSDEQVEMMEQSMSEEDRVKTMEALGGMPELSQLAPTPQPARPAPGSETTRAESVPVNDQALGERAAMGDEDAICELARRAGKLIEIVSTLEGEYSDPRTGANKTWNIDTLCDGQLLRMFANWGDVAPWHLKPFNDNKFEWHDPRGGAITLVFEVDEDRVAQSVQMTEPQGETVTLERLGPPRTYD